MNLMRVLLMFQDLLQLQYEGVAVIELFNDAKVNVNLLIFLLNKKFYSAGKWSIQDVQEFPKELENILAFSMCNKLLELVSNIIDLSQIVMLWHCEGKAAVLPRQTCYAALWPRTANTEPLLSFILCNFKLYATWSWIFISSIWISFFKYV